MQDTDFNDPNNNFVYDETSPSRLRWKVSKKGVVAGSIAGTKTKKGYWAVQLRGSPKLVGRVVWEMFHGPFEGIILYKDCDPSNACIDNLYVEVRRNNPLDKSWLHGRGLKNILDYKDGMLYWKINRYSGMNNSVINALTGEPVHCWEDKDGYKQFKIHNLKYKRLHRAVWEWHNGEIQEGMQIDHLDRDKSNNRIENLRLVSHTVNGRNVSLSSRNNTGYMGVRYRDRGNGSFIAFWNDDVGKLKDKSFSVKKYGYDKAKQLAIEYREKMIEELNGRGFGYTSHHGGY